MSTRAGYWPAKASFVCIAANSLRGRWSVKNLRRRWWLAAIAIAAIVLISLASAPNNRSRLGSTYSRSPDGYGAWYAYMQNRGTPVKRWQKPPSELSKQNQMTLLRVLSQSNSGFNYVERQWVERGNTLIILGIRQPVTPADFSTKQQNDELINIKIDTQRRAQVSKQQRSLLGDRYGAVVWQEKIGAGQVIFCVTPYLAANAYQDYPNNYKYLAQLVTQPEQPIWVDEYIHGYRDQEVRERAGERDFLSYLAQKPLAAALFQAAIVLVVFILASNRCFGQPATIATAIADNSTAYIEALAGVLQKAQASDFVIDTVGNAEQKQLQQALGLGQIPLERQELIHAWAQQTGRSPDELEQLLRLHGQKRRPSDTDLLNWLKQWRTIRSYVKPD